MKKRLFILLIFVSFCPLLLCGQATRIYTSDNGLPNSQINRIHQDDKGVIWLATEGGLIRFDGLDFEAFRHDSEKEYAISSSSVVDIYQDSRGTKWVGTANGLNLFDSDHNRFLRFALEDNRNPAANQYISSLLEVPDRNGGSLLYVATSGSGIYVIDPATQERRDDIRERLFQAAPNEYIRSLFLDNGRHIWILPEGTGRPAVLDADKLTPATDIRWSADLLQDDGQLRFGAFARDPLTGDILFSSSRGLLLYVAAEGLVRHVRGRTAADTHASAILFNSQAEPGEGRSFLLGNGNGGLLQFDMQTEEVSAGTLASLRQDSSNWTVSHLFEDTQGNIWIGLYQKGLAVAPKSMFGFTYQGFSSRGIPGENSACIISVYEDGPRLWVATDGAGLFCQTGGSRGRTVCYNRDNSILTNNSVMAVTGDAHGTIWLGTYQDGLLCLEGGVIHRFPEADRIGTDRIRTLAYDAARDQLYVGTSGNGLVVIDAATRRIKSHLVEDEYRWISALHQDASGLLWVGTYNGPQCYDPLDDRIVPFNILSQGETIQRVYAICSGADGTMWFGTEEGLFQVNTDTQEVRQYTEQDGLANNVIRDILCTPTGDLWIATASGLSRLSPRTGQITSYHASDGLQSNEFRSGAAFKGPSGRLYFGGINGLTSFSPLLLDGGRHEIPQVSLSHLTLLDREVTYDPDKNGENLIDKHLSEATKIRIPKGVDLFSIAFSVPEYTNPQRVLYAYRLRGYDSDWKTAPARQRSATYTNVPPGRYQFEVKAYFDGSPEEYSSRQVSIRVEARWFRQGWAYLLYLLLLTAAGWMLYRMYRDRQRQKKQQKETALKELRLGLFTNLTHEIRTPLSLVMGPLRTLREDEQDPVRKDTYNLMYRNCLRINRLVDQLMDIRKIDAGQMQLHFRETDIIYFIRDIMQSFDSLSRAKNIHFTLTPEHAEELLWVDQGNFDKIIYNILSNAFKHTPNGGRIQLSVSGPAANRDVLRSDIREYVEVDIFNSGSRIEEEYISRIFDRFVQINPYDANSGSGVGLNLTKMLVEMHHGGIWAENRDDGVVFRVLLPAGNAHLSGEELSATTHHKDLYVKGPDVSADSHEDEIYAQAKSVDGKAVRTRRDLVVIEDDDDAREYLKTLLGSRYNVTACASGQEAWPVITTTLPDAVVTDLVMPGMTGSELCARIRQNPATNHIPVLILTGQSGEREQQAASDSGADKFLSKPISVELLLSSIAQVISARETVKGKFGGAMSFDYSGIKMGSADEKLLRRIVESIQTHMDDPEYDVSALCRDVGISRVHLNRKLKENGNVPPSILIRSYRMKQAAYLLANNKVNVSEVAYRVGFASHSYFSSSFREFFGMTPREFVARFLENPDDENLKKLFE